MSGPKDLGDIFKDIFIAGTEAKIKKSWTLANREERKARLRAVMHLSAELEKIKAKTIQSVGLAETVIEDIIEGEWENVADFLPYFTFEDEPGDMRAVYGPIYEGFLVAAQTACAEHARMVTGERSKPH